MLVININIVVIIRTPHHHRHHHFHLARLSRMLNVLESACVRDRGQRGGMSQVRGRRGYCQQLPNARVWANERDKNGEGKSMDGILNTVVQPNVASAMQRG